MSLATCKDCDRFIDTDADNYKVRDGLWFVCEICTEEDDGV